MHKTLYLFLTNPMHHWLFHCSNIRLLGPLCPERMGQNKKQNKNRLTNKQTNKLLINCCVLCLNIDT